MFVIGYNICFRLKKDTLEPDMSHFAAPVSDSGSSHDHFVMIEPSNQPDVSDNKPETLHRRNECVNIYNIGMFHLVYLIVW